MSLEVETYLFWGQKVKVQGHELQKHYRRESLTLVSADCF